MAITLQNIQKTKKYCKQLHASKLDNQMETFLGKKKRLKSRLNFLKTLTTEEIEKSDKSYLLKKLHS